MVGTYVVRTSSLNDKHSCQLFQMGFRDKITPTLTTPLIRSNMSCDGNYHLSSLAFLSSSTSMDNLSCLVAASFSSLALLSSSVSTANLSYLLATTFSSLRLLFNLFRSPHFNILRVARRLFLWFSVFLCSCLILSISFLYYSVSEALFALSFSFLSERSCRPS